MIHLFGIYGCTWKAQELLEAQWRATLVSSVSATREPGTSYQSQRHRIPITMAKIHNVLTSEKEEDQHHDQCVAEVQEGRGCSCDVQFGDKEMNRVQKEIHCSTSASQEGTPPPMIILQLSKALKIRRNIVVRDTLQYLYTKNTQILGKDLVTAVSPFTESDFRVTRSYLRTTSTSFEFRALQTMDEVLNIRYEAHHMRVPARCKCLGLAPARQSNLQTHTGER